MPASPQKPAKTPGTINLDDLAAETSPVKVTLGGEEFELARDRTYQAITATYAGDLEGAMRALIPDPAEYARFAAHPLTVEQIGKIITRITGLDDLGEAQASSGS